LWTILGLLKIFFIILLIFNSVCLIEPSIIAYLNPFVDALPMESVATFQCGNVIKCEGTGTNATTAKTCCCF
jgi:hypothetical protein